MAIEVSRQFKQDDFDKRLKMAQIIKLESDAAKTRQDIFESIGKMYGSGRSD